MHLVGGWTRIPRHLDSGLQRYLFDCLQHAVYLVRVSKLYFHLNPSRIFSIYSIHAGAFIEYPLPLLKGHRASVRFIKVYLPEY